MQHLFVSILAPSFEKAVKVDFRARTQRRLALVALAARLYAADHNDQLPASLDDLVPNYLPAIPMDGMSGKPLLFKTDPPRVYSVGDDGVDDGGCAGRSEHPGKIESARRCRGVSGDPAAKAQAIARNVMRGWGGQAVNCHKILVEYGLRLSDLGRPIANVTLGNNRI